MKMSTVKKFFDHTREVKERNRVRTIQQEEKRKEKELEVIEVVPKSRREHIDDVLYNRIQDENLDVIKWFITQLNQDEIDFILKKRESYSLQLQHAIHELFDPVNFVRCSKNKRVTEIDDYQLFKIQNQVYEDYEKILESNWNEYKLTHSLSRPLLDIDTELTELNVNLEKHKTELKNYPQKYVPRNAVRPVDQKLENLKVFIQKLENEIKSKTEEIKTLDKQWNDYEKRKYQMLSV
jgi:hypothetical protein